MEITVSQESKRFSLSYQKGWKQGVGHQINVGPYRFSAVATTNSIIISEITSGYNMLNLPINFYVMLRTATKESAMDFYKEVGGSLKKLILSQPNFDELIKNAAAESAELFGPMPPIEVVETDWIFEESNGEH